MISATASEGGDTCARVAGGGGTGEVSPVASSPCDPLPPSLASSASPASSMSLSMDSTCSKDFITVVDIQKARDDADDPNDEFITVLSVGDQVITEDITIYRAQGERIGMALKFEGGTGPGDPIDKVFIQTVNADSPAARACGPLLSSLRAGDQIVRIQGRPVNKMKRTDCVTLLRDAPVCISLHVQRLASAAASASPSNRASESCQASPVSGPVPKKGPPPPVPPRLSTTTLSTSGSSQCNSVNNKNAINNSVSAAVSSVSSGQCNNANGNVKTVTSPGNSRKKPPPLPPRRPRDPPPAAPTAKSVPCNGHSSGKSASASPSPSPSPSSSCSANGKRILSPSAKRTSDVHCNNQSKNKRSESCVKKPQQVREAEISDAAHSTPQAAQVYMDILDKEGALESESDDTCSSVSTIIDKFQQVSAPQSRNSNCGLRKTPTIDLDAILAPFQQLEKELDSRATDHSALQKFVDDTKAVMSDIHLTQVNFSAVNLDDYDDIASVSPIVTSAQEHTQATSPSKPCLASVDSVQTKLTDASGHVKPEEAVATVNVMKRANVSPNSLRVCKAKVKEVKLLTGKTRGILKASSNDAARDKSVKSKAPPASAASAVQVTSLIPKLGAHKSSSSPVLVPRKSRSMGNLSSFDPETCRPSLIPRPVGKVASLGASCKAHSQSTRDINKSYQVATKCAEKKEDESKSDVTRKSTHEQCARVYNGPSDTEQSDQHKQHKVDVVPTHPAPLHTVKKVHSPRVSVREETLLAAAVTGDVTHESKQCPGRQCSSVSERVTEQSVQTLFTSHSDLSSPPDPVDNVSRQPVFKEDQHLIKSYSAHDTEPAHHEVDPVSVGDDKDEQREAISSSHSALCEDAAKNGALDSSSCSSGGEDNTSPLLLRSVKTNKVRHDDSGVFSEQTDSPSPDCMSVKRSPFGPFHRSPVQVTASSGATLNDETTSTISCQSTSSSSDPGVTSISSDCLTDGDNTSENGSEGKKVAVNKVNGVHQQTLEVADEGDNDKQNVPTPSVKERIALFQAVVEASSYKPLSSKTSKSLYDIRNEWNKSHPSNHRSSSTDINRSEIYSPSSSQSSESGDIVPSACVPCKPVSTRRYISNESLSTNTDNQMIALPLVSEALDSRRHTKVPTSILQSVVKETDETALCNKDDVNSNNGQHPARQSSSNVPPRPFYSMSDLVTPSLASSPILSSLRINPPKYSPALKRCNPEMLTRSSDFSQYTVVSSAFSSLSAINQEEADRSDTVTSTGSSGNLRPADASSRSVSPSADSSSSIKCKEIETSAQVKSANDCTQVHSVCQVDKETNKRSESDDDTSNYIDSAKHFRELARKWEARISRDREQSKIIRPSVAPASKAVSSGCPSAVSSLHRRVADDIKAHHSSDNLSLLSSPPPPVPCTENAASSSDASTDSKVEKTRNGTITDSMVSPVTCARWPIDNNDSPVARNSSSLQEDESAICRESNKSNSDRCPSEASKAEKEKSDAFSLVKAVESSEISAMSSIDSSTSDSGTSSPGFSGSSIGVQSGVHCSPSSSSPSAICRDTSSVLRSNGVSNLRKNDQQYGSVTSLASSTSVICPQELQQLIEDAKSSIDSGEVNCGQHNIQVVVLNRDYSSNGPVGISLAGGADCETKEITVHRIITGSIADRDGKVKKGDIILSINGKMMRGVSHREAVEVLRSPASEVVLVLARSNDASSTSSYSRYSSSGLDSPSRMSLGLECALSSSLASLCEETSLGSPNKAYKIVRASLHKDGAGLGFILEGGKDSPLGDRPLAIKKIFKGGLADKEGTLIAGDELICVNDQSVEHMTRTEAWNFLKKLPNAPVHMVVRRVDYGF